MKNILSNTKGKKFKMKKNQEHISGNVITETKSTFTKLNKIWKLKEMNIQDIDNITLCLQLKTSVQTLIFGRSCDVQIIFMQMKHIILTNIEII